MCWNKAVSLNTFLFSMFAVSLALFNNVVSIPDALFFISFSSMQLVEYFVWSNMNNTGINTFLSKIGTLLLIIQPFISLFGIDNLNIRYSMVSLYVLYVIFVYTYIKPLNTVDFSTTRAENGHLAWNWLNVPLYSFVIWLAFLVFPTVYAKEYIKLFVCLVLISMIYYTYIASGTWGSLLCWISNGLAFVFLYKVFYKSHCEL